MSIANMMTMHLNLNINNIKHSSLVFLFVVFSFTPGCSTPKIQPPSGISQTPILESNQFISDDGYRLPLTRYWPHLPEYADPKGIVIALHGFNDYSKAFEGMCQYFVSRDMACVSYDQRGFGDTEMTGIWPQAGRLQKDLHIIIELLHEQNPELPIFLAGESMGGAVILTAISDSSAILDKGIQGAILYAPAVWARSTQPWYQKFVLWVLVHTFPSWTPTGMSLDIQATDNIEALKAMGQDDKIIKATRIDTIYGLIDLMDAALLASKDVSINTLVLYGEKDEIIPKKPTCEMLQHMRSVDKNVRFKHYPDGYHMLTRDLQANRVFEDSLVWMSAFQLESQRENLLEIDQFQSEKLSKENPIGYCDEL